MAIIKIPIDQLIELKKSLPVLDVRSTGEYKHAHICDGYSLPIFDNEERKIIGTAYKQESREKAIRLGLAFFGKKLLTLVDETENIIKNHGHEGRDVIVHCWRGGMRSAAVAWLLDLYGFKVYLLLGGYKTYRHWVLEQFEKKYNLHLITGCTGSNKTGLLLELKSFQKSVIDLEGIALHKGSTFGNLDEHAQPSQEQFENLLAESLYNVSQNAENKIWIEGESQRIGQINIPKNFYLQMLASQSTRLEIPFEERLKHILAEYGHYDKEKIKAAILRITKKLGGLETKTALEFLEQNDLKSCYDIILKYYDKLYRRSPLTTSDNQNSIYVVESNVTNATTNAQLILNNESTTI